MKDVALVAGEILRAMSQENVEIVGRMYAAFYGGDTDGALAYFHPDVIVDARGWTLGIGHGREELTRILTTWVGTFDEWREEVEEMRDLGSQVYVAAIERGRGKGSGVEVENRYALLYEIEGDKITRMTPYTEPAEALEAAGISE